MNYQIVLAREAARFLCSLRDKKLKGRLDTAILTLSDSPRSADCKKLSGMAHTYRKRVGDYRIVYEIDDEKIRILLLAIGHRREIYK